MFIDLTLPINEKIPVFPGNPIPEITQIASIDEKGWNEKRLTFNSHFSTHIDAPRHMLEKGKTLSEYSIESFIGKAIVFDVRGESVIDVDVDSIKSNDIVFFYTGYSSHIYESDYFENNPVISKDTIEQLIKKKISILGIDSFTPDNEPYSLHKKLFHHDIRIVENLIHLDLIPKKRFFCYIFPLNIEDADGAPCRVVAQV
jgi:kynurenine formamidase